MKNATTPATTTRKPLSTGCTLDASCYCSDCVEARMPTDHPEDCPCLICLVDSLSANPPPRRKAA